MTHRNGENDLVAAAWTRVRVGLSFLPDLVIQVWERGRCENDQRAGTDLVL